MMDITFEQQYYQGRFFNLLRWPQLDNLWQTVKAQPHGWYVYFIGEAVPTAPVAAEQLTQFIEEIDKLLREEHDYDYCGIVYVDNKENPTLIKIFDPNHLGASCGSSGTTILPRWLLSRIQPCAIRDNAPLPANRKRWWQRLWSRK